MQTSSKIPAYCGVGSPPTEQASSSGQESANQCLGVLRRVWLLLSPSSIPCRSYLDLGLRVCGSCSLLLAHRSSYRLPGARSTRDAAAGRIGDPAGDGGSRVTACVVFEPCCLAGLDVGDGGNASPFALRAASAACEAMTTSSGVHSQAFAPEEPADNRAA